MVAETQTETPPKAKKSKPQPPKSGKPRPKDDIPRAVSFFDRMGAISKADWGTRAKVKIYRTEPFTDLVRVTGQKYAIVYEEPITEERLKHDCGSGRYRLYLSYKAPADDEKEIDSVELEILDPKFPPNLPKGSWIDDPKNKKWEWAKPLLEARWAAETPEKPGNLNTVVETVRAVKELIPTPAPSNGVTDVLNTIRAVKELSPAPPPSTENAMLNSIVQLVIAQNTAAQAALMAAQERGDKLLTQLLTLSSKPAENNGLTTFKGILAEIKDIVGVDTIKDLFNRGADVVTQRSRMNAWQEFFAPAVTKLADGFSNLSPLLIQVLMNRAQQPPQPQIQPVNGQPTAAATLPAANPQPQPNPQSRGGPNLIDLLNIITPVMANHFREWIESGDEEWNGAGFATWVYDGWGQVWNGIDWHAQAKNTGAATLVMMYKQSPFWANPQMPFAQQEPKFLEFVQSFCDWSPDEPEQSDTAPTEDQPPSVEVM